MYDGMLVDSYFHPQAQVEASPGCLVKIRIPTKTNPRKASFFSYHSYDETIFLSGIDSISIERWSVLFVVIATHQNQFELVVLDTDSKLWIARYDDVLVL